MRCFLLLQCCYCELDSIKNAGSFREKLRIAVVLRTQSGARNKWKNFFPFPSNEFGSLFFFFWFFLSFFLLAASLSVFDCFSSLCSLFSSLFKTPQQERLCFFLSFSLFFILLFFFVCLNHLGFPKQKKKKRNTKTQNEKTQKKQSIINEVQERKKKRDTHKSSLPLLSTNSQTLIKMAQPSQSAIIGSEITNLLEGLSENQLYEIMYQLKVWSPSLYFLPFLSLPLISISLRFNSSQSKCLLVMNNQKTTTHRRN